MRSGLRGLFTHPREDFLASIVVFLVALPLCIGIAVAVGVSPARALITGIIGGVIVGLISGSPLQVSGPAAGLFVIVADILAKNKARYLDQMGSSAGLESEAVEYALLALGAAVMVGGLLQIAAGWLRLGQWFRAVSPAVIKGMLAGIGVLIVVSQLHVMLDHRPMWGEKPAHGGLQYIATIPEALAKTMTFSTDAPHHVAAMVGCLTIVLLVVWQKFGPARLRLIPAPLVAILAVTALVAALRLPAARIEIPGQLLTEISLPGWQSLPLLADSSILLAGLVIGLVASAETLLCATAVDQMHGGQRTQYDKELMAQGVGNTLCGLLAALPMTGVIVRSSANVQAGAKTRLSTILHGCWLLLFVMALPGLLAYIPRASLGAMLVYIGWKLISFKDLRALWKMNRAEAGIFLATTTIIVVEDLLLGVVVGIALSAAKLLHTFTNLEIHGQPSADGRRLRLNLRGAATFIRLPKLAARLESVPAGTELHIDLHELDYIDHACLELLMNWTRRHEADGGSLIIDWDSLHAKFAHESAARAAPASPSREGLAGLMRREAVTVSK